MTRSVVKRFTYARRGTDITLFWPRPSIFIRLNGPVYRFSLEIGRYVFLNLAERDYTPVTPERSDA